MKDMRSVAQTRSVKTNCGVLKHDNEKLVYPSLGPDDVSRKSLYLALTDVTHKKAQIQNFQFFKN